MIWDFADGTTANGTVVNHTYSTVGQFDVTITATDTFGAVSTKHMAVDVQPVAADAGPDQSRVEGDQVELGGPNSSPADGSVNFVWDFGDGSEPGSGRTASHTFPRNGTYTVTQTATDEGGTATDRAVITVANADPVISALFGSGPTAVGDRSCRCARLRRMWAPRTCSRTPGTSVTGPRAPVAPRCTSIPHPARTTRC